jgi:hypothetical protein
MRLFGGVIHLVYSLNTTGFSHARKCKCKCNSAAGSGSARRDSGLGWQWWWCCCYVVHVTALFVLCFLACQASQ